MEEKDFDSRNTTASKRRKGEGNWTLQKTNKETKTVLLMYQF